MLRSGDFSRRAPTASETWRPSERHERDLGLFSINSDEAMVAALLLPFCVSYSLLAAPRPPTVQRAAVLALADEEPHATLIFIRHGQSEWNAASLFTGWADVGLLSLIHI